MPFTVAHAAVAVPLRRAYPARLRLAALAMGAASPDFQYFLHLNTVGRFGHTLLGVLVFCLPTSLLGLWLWDRYGRHGVQAMLPPGWQLPSRPSSIPGHWIVASILFGALSHLAWDGFTHEFEWGVQLVPSLRSSVQVAGRSIPWFKILQHGSTLLGLGVLGYALVKWSRTQPTVPLLALLGYLLRPLSLLGLAGVVNGLRFWDQGFRSFVVAGGVAVTLAMGVGAVIWGMIHRPRASGV